MTSPVLYHAAEGVATITLNRPDVLNALNSPLMLELRAAVERAAQDEAVRAVVLTANGRGFCAGADLAGREPGLQDSGTLLRERYHPIILALRNMPKPVITSVNGVAAGAGPVQRVRMPLDRAEPHPSRTIVVRHEVHEAVAQIADAVEEEHRVHSFCRPERGRHGDGRVERGARGDHGYGGPAWHSAASRQQQA